MRVFVSFFCLASILSMTGCFLNSRRILEDSKGAHSGDATYAIGNIVELSGEYFACNEVPKCNDNAPSPDASVDDGWEKLNVASLDLSNDNWDANTQYNQGDSVVYHMYNWTCGDAAGCLGVNPLDSQNAGNHWNRGAPFDPNAGNSG